LTGISGAAGAERFAFEPCWLPPRSSTLAAQDAPQFQEALDAHATIEPTPTTTSNFGLIIAASDGGLLPIVTTGRPPLVSSAAARRAPRTGARGAL